MKRIVPTAVAIGVGLITLLGYFIQIAALQQVQQLLLNWAVTLAGLAVLVGVVNLLIVNGKRVDEGSPGWPYSLITILAALATITVGVIESGIFGSLLSSIVPEFQSRNVSLYHSGTITEILFRGVISPAQAGLLSLIMFLLVTAAVRMMRTKPSRNTVLFLASVVIVLVGWLPFGFMTPMNSFHEWFLAVPIAAGVRGILIGVALGILTIGIRVLTGLERLYKD